MIIFPDEEINNASNIIDKNLERLNGDNRGEISTNILNAIRNLNDNIAYKIWNDKFPDKPMNINKVASKFTSVNGCQFIAHFDKCMRKSLSHFTPSEQGAIFLLSKYYKYIYQLKQVMKELYNIDIIKNIDLYFEDKIDEQSLAYYTKIADVVDISKEDSSDMDIFYICSSRPFRIDDKLYYEVVIEPAEEVSNKFNRITAFTKFDIDTNYAVALKFSNNHIDLLDKQFPIKIITKWQKADIGIWQFGVGDPVLFTDSERFGILYNNLKGKIVDIEDQVTSVKFTIEVNIKLEEDEVNDCDGLTYIASTNNKTTVSFNVDRHKPYYFDNEPENKKHVLPFQVAYAVSIHKSQGLEYSSVKIVISNETENKITHDIFYTAITRAQNYLKIYWPYSVANKILSTIKPKTNNDSQILKALYFNH